MTACMCGDSSCKWCGTAQGTRDADLLWGGPCKPGAWGSDTSCASHEGYDIGPDGVCIDGRGGRLYRETAISQIYAKLINLTREAEALKIPMPVSDADALERLRALLRKAASAAQNVNTYAKPAVQAKIAEVKS